MLGQKGEKMKMDFVFEINQRKFLKPFTTKQFTTTWKGKVGPISSFARGCV